MESGIDLGFDLAALSDDVDFGDLEEVIGTLKNQQEYYEPKARTVPGTERFVFDRSLHCYYLIGSHVRPHVSADVILVQIEAATRWYEPVTVYPAKD